MKRIAALILCIALTLLAAGCANTKTKNPDVMEFTGGKAAANAAGTDAAAAEGVTVVYGRVDSIVGNEVTLALGEPAEGAAADSGEAPDAAGADRAAAGGEIAGGAATGERASGGKVPSGGKLYTAGELPSDGEVPSGGKLYTAGEMPSGGSASGRSASLTYSGETAKYLLPVGMAIGTGDFSDVSVGMVLSITFNAEDTITAVSILSR